MIFMGLDEVINVLKRHKEKWMYTSDIRKELNLSPSTVSTNLKALRKRESIKYKIFRTEKNRPVYIYKYKEGE